MEIPTPLRRLTTSDISFAPSGNPYGAEVPAPRIRTTLFLIIFLSWYCARFSWIFQRCVSYRSFSQIGHHYILSYNDAYLGAHHHKVTITLKVTVTWVIIQLSSYPPPLPTPSNYWPSIHYCATSRTWACRFTYSQECIGDLSLHFLRKIPSVYSENRRK